MAFSLKGTTVTGTCNVQGSKRQHLVLLPVSDIIMQSVILHREQEVDVTGNSTAGRQWLTPVILATQE
jgi:hypothetical protein